MAYRITGNYVAACNCRLICPCPIDGTPTGDGDECRGFGVWAIREGNLDGTDLSGVSFALWNRFPSNLSSGNWTMGVVIDEGASDEQAQALERILSGQEGGPFAEFAPLIGDFHGVERGAVSLSGNSVSVGGRGEATFEPSEGPGGGETTVSNAMFGFAPAYKIGRASGRFRVDRDVDARYGEGAEFEYSSEMGAEAPHGRA
jgi:hypothetical protein